MLFSQRQHSETLKGLSSISTMKLHKASLFPWGLTDWGCTGLAAGLVVVQAIADNKPGSRQRKPCGSSRL